MLKLLKKFMKNHLPILVIEWLKLIRQFFLLPFNYIVDLSRYFLFSATFGIKLNKHKLQAMLIKQYHIVEKGMSLPEPRPGFGQDSIKKLVHYIDIYLRKYGWDETIVIAVNALRSYQKFNDSFGVKLKFLDNSVLCLEEKMPTSFIKEKRGGVITVTKESLLHLSSSKFSDLANSRYSVRVFSGIPVDNQLIREAARIALKTPSVCNRQSTKIYVYGGQKTKEKLLALQNGNRGFGDKASHIAVITSDLHSFQGAGERNQAYIDGGLMAMSFVYALHSLGIGTCFLNWSVTVDLDMKLRKVTNIQNSEVIITLIAIGNLPDTFKVAESPRRQLEEVLHTFN